MHATSRSSLEIESMKQSKNICNLQIITSGGVTYKNLWACLNFQDCFKPSIIKYFILCFNYCGNKILSLLSDHHVGRRDVQERALAPRVLHLHQLRLLPRWPTLHLPGWEALLCRLLRQPVCQALHRLREPHHRYLRDFFTDFQKNRIFLK